MITLPRLNSNICPVGALKIIDFIPTTKNAPLFKIRYHTKWLPLTDSKIRANYKTVLALLKINPSFFTFHSFRRSEATNFKIFRNKEYGAQTVSGGTSQAALRLVLEFQLCFRNFSPRLGLACFHSKTI